MEKETERILRRVLDTMLEQQQVIRALEHKFMPSTRASSDGIADRIQRIIWEIDDPKRFMMESPETRGEEGPYPL